MTRITTGYGHGYIPGDQIEITQPDLRWWMRLWHWLLLRDPPTMRVRYRCTSVTQATMEIE
jgi:hypothetical protein